MQSNKLTIVIQRPVEAVFEFTINPKNTPLWIEGMVEEISSEFPPHLGTIYKNRRDDLNWEMYKVVEFEKNKLFTLQDAEGNYPVRYTFKPLSESETEMTYFEWVESGEIKHPFSQDVLVKLKAVMEK